MASETSSSGQEGPRENLRDPFSGAQEGPQRPSRATTRSPRELQYALKCIGRMARVMLVSFPELQPGIEVSAFYLEGSPMRDENKTKQERIISLDRGRFQPSGGKRIASCRPFLRLLLILNHCNGTNVGLLVLENTVFFRIFDTIFDD